MPQCSLWADLSLARESKPTLTMHHIQTYLGQLGTKLHLSMPPPSTFVSFPSI